ncbi:hypothetical protein TRIP_B330412 [uncultured Desulfatiglans sp.]|uniref:Uncharacterized protein n=1 Tax=Uncultured Desulfatiglans sp. TaxID=1748965 RepID=A0A653A8E4_UNCDX|nr:hypothetical protein TRIP_B330412 [uncultured Desulfatiglans sp.]
MTPFHLRAQRNPFRLVKTPLRQSNEGFRIHPLGQFGKSQSCTHAAPLLYALGDAVPDPQGNLGICIDHDDSEFIPAVAVSRVDVLADAALQGSPYLFEQTIPRRVPVFVVELFECLEIEKNEGKRPLLSGGAYDLLIENRKELPPVEKPCQNIRDRELQQFERAVPLEDSPHDLCLELRQFEGFAKEICSTRMYRIDKGIFFVTRNGKAQNLGLKLARLADQFQTIDMWHTKIADKKGVQSLFDHFQRFNRFRAPIHPVPPAGNGFLQYLQELWIVIDKKKALVCEINLFFHAIRHAIRFAFSTERCMSQHGPS